MNVPLYEKIWMWAAGGIIVAFITTVLVAGIGSALVPPSHIETIDPAEIHVPAGRPVTFRMTSADVTHGFLIVGTNANTMLVPGYVSQFTTTFRQPGEYLIVCNEYCGLSHHLMSARLIVEEARP